jgi:hypothetical protein
MIRTIASAPAATRWHGVADTLHSHQSESLGRLAAAREKRSEDLGHTGTRGLLRSLSMRAAFLADPPHPMVFHSTPKHASRMNHMELWCSLLMRQFLKRASCTSVEDLQARILAFLPYCNATMAKPFTWTYGQTPLYV